jgi:ornithine carbamoyltransferase
MSDRPREFLKSSDLSPEQFREVVALGLDFKLHPEKYTTAMANKTLLMFFEKPSLRTRVSLETAMTKLGGHAIYYPINSLAPLGKKETVFDTARVITGMVDVVCARLNSQADTEELSHNLDIPFLSAMSPDAHPLQMLADAMTILEFKHSFEGLTFTYCGDFQNVAFDLMRMCALTGMNCRVAGPTGPGYGIPAEILAEVEELHRKAGTTFTICKTVEEAVTGTDAIYCDSFMSYGIPQEELDARLAILMPFQVKEEHLEMANPGCLFMNCLPAKRGYEQTAGVIDGPHSVVFPQAHNRMHSAIGALLWFTKSA